MELLFNKFPIKSLSQTSGPKMIHHEVLCNYQFEESLVDKESQDRNWRTKRDEQKNNINLPPDYNIYTIPKPSDKSPMPVFLFVNMSKILDWNEFNEVLSNEKLNRN